MTHLQQGLGLFAARGHWQQFQNSARRLMSELAQRGLTGQAEQIEAILKASLPAGFVSGAGAGVGAAPEKGTRVLPTNCPGCGSLLHPDEIEWTDDITAECPYCGSPVRAEA